MWLPWSWHRNAYAAVAHHFYQVYRLQLSKQHFPFSVIRRIHQSLVKLLGSIFEQFGSKRLKSWLSIGKPCFHGLMNEQSLSSWFSPLSFPNFPLQTKFLVHSTWSHNIFLLRELWNWNLSSTTISLSWQCCFIIRVNMSGPLCAHKYPLYYDMKSLQMKLLIRKNPRKFLCYLAIEIRQKSLNSLKHHVS